MENVLKKLSSFVLVLLLSGLLMTTFGQTTPTVIIPDLELKGNKVIISYDIRTHNDSDRFNVWVEITDSNGNPINAKTFNGDVGPEIIGGNRKEVVWDPDADNIELEIGIYVQVFAELVKQAPEFKEPVVREEKVKTRSVVLQSLLFPGLGLSLVTNGKPHWLRGVAGYGCIVTSVTLNRMAASTFEEYQDATDANSRNDLFNTAKNQDNLSEGFAYAAIGIWITDVVWNIVASSRMNAAGSDQTGGFTIKTQYDPGTHAPLLTFRYAF